MGEIAINVNGRAYRFDCGEGEEARLKELAAYIRGRVEQLKHEHGSVGGERLMLMAALLIADELFDAREALAGKAPAKAEAEDADVSAEPDGEAAAVPDAAAREQDAIRAEYRRKMAAGEA